jgi:four helix bundle protein
MELQVKRQKSKVGEQRELGERMLEYGARIIRLVEALPRTVVGRRIGDQLLRSRMAVGANYEEARAEEPTDDFIHKLQLALQELRESYYWLRLLTRAKVAPAERLRDLKDESGQLIAVHSKAVATAKSKRRVAAHS